MRTAPDTRRVGPKVPKVFGRAVVIAALLALLLVLAQLGGVSSALEGESLPTESGPAGPDRSRLWRELAETAESVGEVRVVVELAASMEPEGDLAVGDVEAQRAVVSGTVDSFLDTLGDGGVEVVRTFVTFPGVSLRLDRGALSRLETLDALIARVALDEPLTPALADGPALLRAPQVWDLGWTGGSATIAIVDSGVDPTLAALGDGQGGHRLVAEACFSLECPNGLTEQLGPGAAAPLPPEYADASHGTSMARLAAGATGGPGVAPTAQVVAVRAAHPVESCGTPEDPYPCSVVSSSGVIAGLDWIATQVEELPVAVVNLSLGGGSFASECADSPFATPIANLRSLDIAVVVSTGNAGDKASISEPACVPGATAVGYAAGDGQADLAVSETSNSSEQVDLWGPGHGLSFGTSAAAAQVSGAVGLLADAFPDATPTEVVEMLRATGFDLVDTNGVVRPFPDLSKAYRLLDAIYGRPCLPEPSTGVPCELPPPPPDDGPPSDCPSGYNLVEVDPLAPVTYGTVCDDFIVGSDGDDVIVALSGDDLVLGMGGDDSIEGGTGDDGIVGGDGADTLAGEWGRDRLVGGSGGDVLVGGDHNDDIWGGDGPDVIDGGWGGDELHGGAGPDEIDGGPGGDEIFGDAGDDVIRGGSDAGNDAVYGGDDDDVVVGQAGNDHLEGNRGRDLVWGSTGIDTVNLVVDESNWELPALADPLDMAWGNDGEDFVWYHQLDQVVGFEHLYPA